MSRDLNDTLQDEGRDAARARLDGARPYRHKAEKPDAASRVGPTERGRTKPGQAPPMRNGKAGRQQQKPKPALEFDDQITLNTKVDALVKGVLYRGDIAVLYGPSGIGKTFTLTDLAYHLALGSSWHGLRVRKAPVLYVGLEGGRGLRHRMLAYREQMGSARRMLARLTVDVSLSKDKIGKAGEAIIIEQAKALGEAAGEPVGLIIIETLARAIAPDDESAAQDMSALVGRMSTIARETGAAVLASHHPGKDDARGMRGSYTLFAACEAVIKINGNGDVREVVTEKVREGTIGPLFSFTLKQVVLGADEDGDQITSCIVESAAPANRKARRPQPESRAGKALNELEQLIIGGKGTPAQGHPRAPDGATLIAKADWRDACRRRHLSDGTQENEKKAFQRAVIALSQANLIGDHGDDVWPLNSA
jgi:AAA domain